MTYKLDWKQVLLKHRHVFLEHFTDGNTNFGVNSNSVIKYTIASKRSYTLKQIQVLCLKETERKTHFHFDSPHHKDRFCTLRIMMRSREISRNSNMWHFHFSIWLFKVLIWRGPRGTFCRNPHLNWSSGSVRNWKDSQNNRKQ